MEKVRKSGEKKKTFNGLDSRLDEAHHLTPSSFFVFFYIPLFFKPIMLDMRYERCLQKRSGTSLTSLFSYLLFGIIHFITLFPFPNFRQ